MANKWKNSINQPKGKTFTVQNSKCISQWHECSKRIPIAFSIKSKCIFSDKINCFQIISKPFWIIWKILVYMPHSIWCHEIQCSQMIQKVFWFVWWNLGNMYYLNKIKVYNLNICLIQRNMIYDVAVATSEEY